MNTDSKKIRWTTFAFMGFSALWGFGNVLNGFVYFNGIQSIFSWILIFALYFIPYALMVGELGSAFKDTKGGVSSWIEQTCGKKIAYYCGWTFWIVHIPYLASKGSGALKALSWVIWQNSENYDSLPVVAIQLATLAVFLFFAYIASKGLNPLKKMATLAGSSMFIMSILYIILMFAAPAINPNASFVKLDFSFSNLVPTFDWKYITSLSILIFAVGGIEKLSPYVSNMENPGKSFPRAIITMTIMVAICAFLGTIAMGMMFDPQVINASTESFNHYATNGSYMAFEILGNYYGVGKLFVIIYALCNLTGQLSTLVVSIDAPLRMLLDNGTARQYIPDGLLKQNKHGAYINGIIMISILVAIIDLIPCLGIGGVTGIFTMLTKLNSVVMPLRYLWVFFAYLALRKSKKKFEYDYHFTKNQKLALFFGGWCFFLTAACCILGMYKEGDLFQTCINVLAPFIFIAIGVILPIIAKKQGKTAD